MSKTNVATSSRTVQNTAKNMHNARASALPDASVSAKTIVITLKLTRHSAMNE
jgi:hypothetical protein